MGNAATVVNYNNFTKGLISEASPLNFPQDAALDLDNVVIDRTGQISRRLGMDYESGYALTDTGKNSSLMGDHSISAFRWDNVNNSATTSIGVIQVGNNLWFVDLFATSPSATLLNGGSAFVLNSSTVGTNISGNELITFAPALGVLVMVSSEMESPYYLTYNSTGDTFSTTKIDVQVRDIWGVDDGLAVDTRPGSLSTLHKYNLLNQGWTNTNINAVAYPSNADVMSLGKDSSDNFDASLLTKQFFGNTPAPKGKYIIDAFNRGSSRQSESGLSGLPSDVEGGKLSVSAFYAGRIIYAGVASSITNGDDESPDYAGYIFFSQTLRNKSQLGECYQVADPTAEHDSVLVPTDGGTIVIPDMNNVFHMEEIEGRLVVFAENGIWEVFGSDAGFAADDFQVSKVTNIGVVNGSSVVNAEGNVFYWSKGGIYTLVGNEITGRLQAQNITETTIQTYYQDSIPSVGRANAVGTYDSASRQIRWLYNDEDSYDGVTDRNKYNRELILDLTTLAFFLHSIKELTTNSPYVAGVITTPNFSTVQNTQDVVVNGEQVQVNGEDVVVTTTVRGRGVSSRKYLTLKPGTTYSLTLSNYNNTSFLDWETDDSTGVDASGYLETGDTVFGDIMRKKQVPFITFHFNRTETGFQTSGGGLTPLNPSGCQVRTKWEFSDLDSSGKWSSAFQAYRLNREYIPSGIGDTFDYGHSVITTKTKIRGLGKAVRFRVETEAGKDMQLLGWAIFVRGGDNV